MYLTEERQMFSTHLEREVKMEFYYSDLNPQPGQLRLLILNDGQDMSKLGLLGILNDLFAAGRISSRLFIAAIVAGNRLSEFGTAAHPDYMGRGYQAAQYTAFLLDELLAFIGTDFQLPSFADHAIAGFSMGGLSAMDIAWAHPELFSMAGIFSGSLWWRSKAIEDGYVEEEDRIMHAIIRKGEFHAGQRFYFEAGEFDETADRNNNGIIDSIDDTLGLIHELEKKGYRQGADIKYVEIKGGRHDVETWARAMPDFLEWGWGPGQ